MLLQTLFHFANLIKQIYHFFPQTFLTSYLRRVWPCLFCFASTVLNVNFFSHFQSKTSPRALCESPFHQSDTVAPRSYFSQFQTCSLAPCCLTPSALLSLTAPLYARDSEEHSLCRFTRSSGCLSFPNSLLHAG